MNMLKRISISAVLLLAGIIASAQSSGEYGSFAPYTAFGLGDINTKGTAYNRTMGGVGVANRNTRFINPLNPASITARDSCSVMADFSLYENNVIYESNTGKSASNVFNINDIIISLPMFKKNSAIVLGLMPYSSIGYTSQTLEQNNEIVGYTGDLKHTNYGLGNMYQLFAGGAVLLWDRLSLGAQWVHYFGYTQKIYTQIFNNSSFSGVSDTYSIDMRADAAKFGLQYEQKVANKLKICVGGTYNLSARMRGSVDRDVYASSSSSAVSAQNTNLTILSNPIRIASEVGAGLSVNYADRLMVEFNWLYSDWTNSNLDKVDGFKLENLSGLAFNPTKSQTFRFGLEWTPNPSDIRYYYKHVSYRAGAYYTEDYYKVGENGINAAGITLGATLPVFRWSNGITVGLDFGKRGTLKDDLVKETYFNFSIGVNLYDIWFQKPTYK